MTVVLALIGCGGAPSSEPTEPNAGWGKARWTQSRKYEVELRLVPEPPPMGELFAVEAVVKRPDGSLVENAQAVYLDALMPQHNHGMMTDPKEDPGECPPAEDGDGQACVHAGGIYRSTGFKFHMPGEWTLTVDVDGPIGRDTTSFVYDMP